MTATVAMSHSRMDGNWPPMKRFTSTFMILSFLFRERRSPAASRNRHAGSRWLNFLLAAAVAGPGPLWPRSVWAAVTLDPNDPIGSGFRQDGERALNTVAKNVKPT